MPQPGLIAGHPTRLRRMGHGLRKVLALHCSLAHAGAWSALADVLGDDVTMIAPDLPGHGGSADAAVATDLHDLSTAIAAELAGQIGAGSPVDVIGHSFGGTVAMRLAQERPDLVRSLTLFEPVLFSAARGQEGAVLSDWLAGQRRIDTAFAEGRIEEAASLFNDVWGHGIPFSRLPESQRRSFAERIHLIPATTHVLWDDAARITAAGRLETIRVPVLLAEGTRSPPIIGLLNDVLAARIPDLTRLRQEGAGHMLPLSHAEELAGAVRAHLERC